MKLNSTSTRPNSRPSPTLFCIWASRFTFSSGISLGQNIIKSDHWVQIYAALSFIYQSELVSRSKKFHNSYGSFQLPIQITNVDTSFFMTLVMIIKAALPISILFWCINYNVLECWAAPSTPSKSHVDGYLSKILDWCCFL